MSSARKPLPDDAAGKDEARVSGVRTRVTPREGVSAVLLREAVDGIVSPEIARRVIAKALALTRAPFPRSIDALQTFVRGPLARALRDAQLGDEAEEIAARVDRLGSCAASADGHATTHDDEPTARIHCLRPVSEVPRERVRVVVFASSTTFADALAASPLAERLAVLHVTTGAALAGALHASGPLLVVIDAAGDADAVDEVSLAATLSGRSAQLSVLITNAERRGQSILGALRRVGVAAIGVAEGGSIDSIAEILVRAHA